ncbi:transposase [Secundilactobacillus oryzae JCM 18671]|uniref:Transposase n=2 Tax=Secundilactobacillus oryzae TaxID=1202668 RepID=A0A081BHG6_9LACO|nr:hypothetical protein [Secundilactobacillus oryzae]GAK47484.1 transposase [Secundilactobacillus oryzae JCM 18671]
MPKKMPTIDPKQLFEFEKEMRQQNMALVKENPWLVPPVVALAVLPVAVATVGFFHNRSLKNKLKIEREKTKQLTLEAKMNQ